MDRDGSKRDWTKPWPAWWRLGGRLPGRGALRPGGAEQAQEGAFPLARPSLHQVGGAQVEQREVHWLRDVSAQQAHGCLHQLPGLGLLLSRAAWVCLQEALMSAPHPSSIKA